MAKAYSHALIDPFNSEALGAQIPDPYSFPTNTTHFRTTYSVTANSDGDFDFVIQPNLLATCYTNNEGSVAGPIVWASATNCTPTVTGFSGQTGVPSFGGVISTADLLTLADQYRIVGMGARFNSELIPQTSTGYLTMCSLPVNPKLPPSQFITQAGNGAATLGRAAILSYMNLPVHAGDGFFDALLQTYPTGAKMNAFEFNQSGIEWNTKTISAKCLEWRDGSNSTSNAATTPGVVANIGDILLTNPANSLHGLYWEDSFLENGGFSNWVVRGSGFPMGLVGNLDIIIHVEYIPATLQNQQSSKFPPVDAAFLNMVQQTNAKLPFYRAITSSSDDRVIQRAVNRIGL